MSRVPERLLQVANHSMVYTDEVISCDSCGERYESGFLTEIMGRGIFCHLCLGPEIKGYFDTHPSADHALIRGISTLAYRRNGTNG